MDRVRTGLRRLIPDPVACAVVAPQDLEPPEGAELLSHEVLALTDDALYRVNGLEGGESGAQSGFVLGVKRVPLTTFARFEATDVYLSDHGAVRHVTTWSLQGSLGGLGGPPFRLTEDRYVDSDQPPDREAKLAAELMARLGWPTEGT